MARRRGHSKSQSVSSAVDSPAPASPSSPKFAKPATPARKPRRSSATSPPASPTSPTTAVAPRVTKAQRQTASSLLLKFPIVAVLGFGISFLLSSAAALYTQGELAKVSKNADSLQEIGTIMLWRLAYLGIFWFGGYDAFDVASLSLLISTPPNLLLGLFYQISVQTLTLYTLANLVAAAIPFVLLRPLSPPHHPQSAPRNLIRNKSILTDPYTTFSTSLLATAIFAVLFELSLAVYLPSFLITHFEHLRTLEFAHTGARGLLTLLIALLPAGVSCTTFLFLPSAGVVKPYLQAQAFNPVTSTFMQHVYHNTWGWYSARQRELIKRTTVAGLMMAAETIGVAWGTLPGVELEGAVGYAGVFIAGLVLVGMVFEWVGGPSG